MSLTLIEAGYPLSDTTEPQQIPQPAGFDIRRERANFSEGKIDKTGLQDDLRTYLLEYLTALRVFSTEYTIKNGLTFARGWDKSLEEMFQDSINVAQNPEEKNLRQAELSGFEELKRGLLENPNPDRIGIYISPKEAYPDSSYSFIYMATATQLETGEFQLKMHMYRLFDTDLDAHKRALAKFMFVPTEIVAEYSALNLIRYPIFIDGKSPKEVLNDMLSKYGVSPRARELDPYIKDQLTQFEPAIDTFISLFQDKEINDEQLQRSFQLFLAKAMVHFDPERAFEIIGAELTRFLQTNSFENLLTQEKTTANRFINLILTTDLDLAGTCDIGFSADFGQKLFQLTHPQINMETDVFICPRCGKVHNISGGNYVTHCTNCGMPAICKNPLLN